MALENHVVSIQGGMIKATHFMTLSLSKLINISNWRINDLFIKAALADKWLPPNKVIQGFYHIFYE